MQPLLRRYALAVALSFIATVCAMVLAAFVSPIHYEVVCSASGHQLVAIDGHRDVHSPSGSGSHGDGSGHCPLCMPAGPPPSFVAWNADGVQPLAHVLRSIPAARLAGLVGAPLPARGPPVLT